MLCRLKVVYDSKSKTSFSKKLTGVLTNGSTKSSEVETSDAGGIANLTKIMGSKNGQFYGILNNFSVFSMSEQQKSIMKVQQNFNGNWNAFFMGSAPTMISISGGLIDSPEFPYYEEFKRAYDTFLEGGKPLELDLINLRDSRVFIDLFASDVLIVGLSFLASSE